MYIERLTLKNFKSFGGTHTLPFAPGFTAIVGPNGSGKSNILDGLRWILGESGSSRLRITRQSDLIFQGSAGLSEATETDVSLDLTDGTDHGALRRHLDASGSVLYVDGARTRVQDLSQFKQKWHLEGDRSAFIGQGEVGAAVLQKPFQRRLQLEELFGIDQYRKKRDDALDELKESTDELTRLQTLMGELRARREELAPDLANARKAQEYERRLDDLRAVLYHTRRYHEEQKLAGLTSKHDAAASRLEAAERWADLWKHALERLRAQGSEYTRLRAALNDELEDLTPRLNDVLRRELALNSEKSENEFAARRAGEERERLSAQLKDGEAQRGETASQAGKLAHEASTLKLRLDDLEDRLAAQSAEIARAREQRRALLEREAALHEEARTNEARAKTLESQGQERASVLDDLRARKDAIVTQLTEADETLEQLEDAVETLETKRGEAATRSQELAVRAQNLRRAVARAEAELDGLLQRAEAGLYPRPVQLVLSAAKLGRLKIDTVPAVEAFTCDAELAPALEAYLGGRQYWLLVDTMAQARTGINLLKERAGGRATFLPLERCRVPRHPAAPNGKDVRGWAIDLVAPSPRWRPALEHLLGDLLVVGSYDTGARLAATARYPIVTLEGEVFSPTGTVSGGKAARTAGAITIRNQIDALERQLDVDRAAQGDAAKKLADAERAESDAAARLDRARVQTDAQRQRTDALRRSLREESGELAALLQEDSGAGERIAACRAAAQKCEAEAAQVRAQIDALPAAADAGPNAELLELRAQSLLADERAATKKAELEKCVRAVSELRRAIVANTEESRRIVHRLADLAERGDAIKAEKSEREAQKKDIEARIAALDRTNAEAARRMERQLLRSQRAQVTYQTLTREELVARTEIERSRERLAALISATEEQHPYPDGFTPTDTIERLDNSARYVERSLRDLGTVNVGALSEDRSLAERLEYLGGQLGDVSNGIDELKKLIASTDKQAASLFGNALTQIDKRFNELFRRLFGGGEAHLKAQENAELWDAGVEIIARPPGKKTLFLAQLSGGEQSLTALSLLFASMEVARVPLAVLDEVDAALDEANLTRFANMVVEYSKNIQVIAMTHRRQTMEHAEIMFGVTMSEPGLSQIVSVRTDQWN